MRNTSKSCNPVILPRLFPIVAVDATCGPSSKPFHDILVNRAKSWTVQLLRLRKILARRAQRKGWSINSCQINSCQINSCPITGRSGGSRGLAEQEFSEQSRRFPIGSHGSCSPKSGWSARDRRSATRRRPHTADVLANPRVSLGISGGLIRKKLPHLGTGDGKSAVVGRQSAGLAPREKLTGLVRPNGSPEAPTRGGQEFAVDHAKPEFPFICPTADRQDSRILAGLNCYLVGLRMWVIL